MSFHFCFSSFTEENLSLSQKVKELAPGDNYKLADEKHTNASKTWVKNTKVWSEKVTKHKAKRTIWLFLQQATPVLEEGCS